MILSVTKCATEHLIDEAVEGEYEMGENDCAARILDVIDAVLSGEDPMGIERVDAMDIMKMADKSGDAAQFRLRETDG